MLGMYSGIILTEQDQISEKDGVQLWVEYL